MINKFLSIIFFFILIIPATGQITTDPALPTASQSVTITFDSSKESRLGKFTGDLYAHTGVMIEGKSDWQHVIESWGNNDTQPKLTNKGDGIYELEITPNINTFYSVAEGEKVTQLAFVFRSADSGKQTNNLLVDVYEDGLVINISTQNNDAILKQNEAITISANSSIEATLSLYLNDTQLSETTGTEITTTHTFTEPGDNWLIAKAIKDAETVYDSVSVYIKEEITAETKPAVYRNGISYPTDESAALVLWAPEKEFVYVLGDFNNWEINEDYQMKKDGDNFWLEINGLTTGQQYVFQYYIDGEIKVADPYCEQTSDPDDQYITNSIYPGLIAYPEGKAEGIASVLQPGQTGYQWEVTDFTPPAKEKMVIYELLIRDFTEEHTYASVIEKLHYLEDLNINVLELMPVNEFEGNSSWGYNPSFYFAPDKYYGPKNELKRLIDECHKKGIAVVIDMVLNHSYGQSPFVRMYADGSGYHPAENNPWYNAEHNFQNTAAQWGSDFNHESEYTRALVDSINSFWMSEYNVDGFRFDFTKGFSNTVYGPSSWGGSYDAARISNLKRMSDEIWERNENAIVIFEHLSDNPEEKELAGYGILLWGNMHGKYTQAAKGNNDGDYSELKGAVFSDRDWSKPNLVAYMESHDEERLMFTVENEGYSSGSYNTRDEATALDRMELNSLFFIPLPGPKMIWQFGELGYDQSINSNGGRLSEKPVLWNYTEEDGRADLFKMMATLNYLKQNYDEFSATTIDYDLTGALKTYTISANGEHVVAVGNFGTGLGTVTASFPETGTWYNYFERSSFTVNSATKNYSLQAGQFKLFTSREIALPEITVSTEEISGITNNIKMYPNPCSNELNIQAPSGIKMVRIFSADGRLQNVVNANNQSIKINTSNLQRGMYILQVLGDRINSYKFIKE